MPTKKEFINLRYPKIGGITWRVIPLFILNIFVFIVILNFVLYAFSYLNVMFKIWQAILFLLIVPVLLNLILRRFGLHTHDITVLFR